MGCALGNDVPAVANSGQDRDSVSRKNSRIRSVSSRNLQHGLVSAAVLDPGCITFFAHQNMTLSPAVRKTSAVWLWAQCRAELKCPQ